MRSEYLNVLLSLSLVLGLMFLLFYFLKKIRLIKHGKNKHINIINVVPIGAKEKIILVEVNNAILLLGATPNHIETLYVFNELELPSALKETTENPKSNFVKHMKGAVRLETHG